MGMTTEDRVVWLTLITQENEKRRRVAASAFDYEFPRGLTSAKEIEARPVEQERCAEGVTHSNEQSPTRSNTGAAAPAEVEA